MFAEERRWRWAGRCVRDPEVVVQRYEGSNGCGEEGGCDEVR